MIPEIEACYRITEISLTTYYTAVNFFFFFFLRKILWLSLFVLLRNLLKKIIFFVFYEFNVPSSNMRVAHRNTKESRENGEISRANHLPA